jgi:hypothetical protein
MPVETMKFIGVDRNFRNNLIMFKNYPLIWEAIENEKIKNDF